MMSWVMRSPSCSKDLTSSAKPERSGNSASNSRNSKPERRMLLAAFSTSVTSVGSAARRRMGIRQGYAQDRIDVIRFTSSLRVDHDFATPGEPEGATLNDGGRAPRQLQHP